MRSGRMEQAAALLLESPSRFTVVLRWQESKWWQCNQWKNVPQLTGRVKSSSSTQNPEISTVSLHDHFTTISTDANYEAPTAKSSVCSLDAFTHVSEIRMFNILDALQPTATGLDNIPAWYLLVLWRFPNRKPRFFKNRLIPKLQFSVTMVSVSTKKKQISMYSNI